MEEQWIFKEGFRTLQTDAVRRAGIIEEDYRKAKGLRELEFWGHHT